MSAVKSDTTSAPFTVEREYLSLAEASALTGLSVKTLRRRVSDGVLHPAPLSKPGGKILISRDQLQPGKSTGCSPTPISPSVSSAASSDRKPALQPRLQTRGRARVINQ